jgi:uncharacterized protein YndB with AHSA1/START domain
VEPDNNSVYVESIINASPEKVWKAWTEPALIKSWFGSDPNGRVLSAIAEVKPGGYFEISFEDGDQSKHTCSGTYQKVQWPTILTFSWQWRNEPGVESFIVLSLAREGNPTRMVLEHLNVGTHSKHDYVNGWLRTFKKLEKLMGD